MIVYLEIILDGNLESKEFMVAKSSLTENDHSMYSCSVHHENNVTVVHSENNETTTVRFLNIYKVLLQLIYYYKTLYYFLDYKEVQILIFM